MITDDGRTTGKNHSSQHPFPFLSRATDQNAPSGNMMRVHASRQYIHTDNIKLYYFRELHAYKLYRGVGETERPSTNFTRRAKVFRTKKTLKVYIVYIVIYIPTGRHL